jgi:predicted permease
MLESISRDVRYGARVLLNNPGFALIAILTMALGIGVNTAIFSLVYGVLLRPLPYENGPRLVVLHQRSGQGADVPFSAQDVFDYRDKTHTLDGVVEHHSMSFLLLGKESAERVSTAVVSANFFDVLGVKPLLGRTFVAADESHGAEAVLVLSNAYWKTRHGGDPNVVGRIFQMNNRPHRVIGVLPAIPQYPVNDVYMPTSQCPFRSAPDFIANRQARMMTAFGRLKPGIPLEKAQADVALVANQLKNAYPEAYDPKYSLALASLADDLTRQGRTTLLVLLGAAGLVLLIACSNVGNLLLARLLARGNEVAIRAALGASRGQLVRQFVVESVLLSIAGGALGLALAPNALAVLVAFAQRFTTRADEIRLDGPVLLFTGVVSLLTGLLFGLAPALASARNTADALKQGSSRTTASRASHRLRSALVVAQVAVSFMLLIGAGLMIRSFARLQQVNPGFNPDRLLAMRLSLNFSHYTEDEQMQVLADRILRSAQAVGGVESAALATNYPFNPGGIASGPGTVDFQIEGRPVSKGELAPIVDLTMVSSDYFRTIRQPLLRGRDFTAHDDTKALRVAIINQTMARHRWPSEDPIGRKIGFDGGKSWLTIIGIAGDAKEYGLDRPVGDEVYVPMKQALFGNRLVIRTAADPTSVISGVRAHLHAIDSQLAIDQVQTVEHLEYESLSSPRVTTLLLGLFAGLALVISASGIAAVMALSVNERAGEIGIRMALGASRESVVYMVLARGLALALGGAILGIFGAFALTRLLSSLLYETNPADAMTYILMSGLFLVVAALACWVPARRVTSIDPLLALRQE